MPTPFPGMDPYLEKPGLWKQIHTDLIVDIRRHLAVLVRPKYQVAIEQRNFLSLSSGKPLMGEPDVLVIAPVGREAVELTRTNAVAVANGSYTASLPEPQQVIERYLEVRDVESGEVITVIEILSPSNRLEDRKCYERKRQRVLASMTNLVEVDLLRSGKPMPMSGNFPQTPYRILVSRALQRPEAQVFSPPQGFCRFRGVISSPEVGSDFAPPPVKRGVGPLPSFPCSVWYFSLASHSRAGRPQSTNDSFRGP
jgi:hypothetical protein